MPSSTTRHARSIKAPVSDPLAYGLAVEGDCLLPIIRHGDVAICSPAAAIEPGMLVAFKRKSGGRTLIKRLTSEYFQHRANGGIVPHFTVEMDNPPKEFLLNPVEIESVHRVVGIIRDGCFIQIYGSDIRCGNNVGAI